MKALDSLPSLTRNDDLDEDGCNATVAALLRGPALTIGNRTLVGEARRLLVEYRAPAIVVIDDNDDVRGIITRTDVLRARDLTVPAEDVMSMFIFALPWTASIERAASLIACEGVGQVLVTGFGNSLLGIVSAVDIARYFALETRRLH
ncbi:MAG: CBS domain-containing protein [Deltaproteobacteria bacterium]|nr:CBS domain-containing protein [Deltaproteobacteria bacterium]